MSELKAGCLIVTKRKKDLKEKRVSKYIWILNQC